jgi:AGCS family alanine or glycine:cation symporter
MEYIESFFATIVGYAWGPPLMFLLVGGGLVLLIYSRFLPFFSIKHGLAILTGRFDRASDPGEISHFQAMSTALAATVGMGNIGGVAIALTQGGPGALFWMWVTAIVGMATKFFTCTLAVMYRGKDSMGNIQGGPMYFIEVGLGPRFRFLGVFFSLCGMVGCLAIFQSNQVAEILYSTYQIPTYQTGIAAFLLVSFVIIGGLNRIARTASMLVPFMCLIYFLSAIWVAVSNLEQVPAVLQRILQEAFTGSSMVGGAAGIGLITVIQTGVKRAAFSNEAGIGTAAMAHGAARTNEPVREGLVAMMEPLIDTVIVCSLTAFIILTCGDLSGVVGVHGVGLTASAFEAAMGQTGKIILAVVVVCFGISTMFGYSYYGRKCFSYLFGAENGRIYDGIFLLSVILGSIWSVGLVVNIIDTAFAMMAIPNMIAALALAPRVMKAARKYFSRLGR